ncbi:MAG: site-specific integrase [Clostridiales bacterium]|nr:site-specific integrase [Clostridiales bacterium]
MVEKRRDSKGRVLWTGESQRSDGKYEFKYADNNGDRHSVYSWKLVATDHVPNGKQVTESLREMEKQIKKDLEDNLLVYKTRKMTLNSFWDEYIAMKYELKESTRSNYIYMYDKYVRPDFGCKNITTIKYSDVKKFYLSLIYDLGFKPNSMETVNTILHPVFTSAVRDGYIRLNPSDGVMAEIKKSHTWEKPKRHALTQRQQELFVNFTAQSHQYKHWLPLITTMLGTGCRIGEVLGLRWEDCDFEQNIISINHTLIYRKFTGEPCHYAVTTPKTKSGERIIPMLSDVKEALKTEYKQQLEDGFNESTIDGYSGFIFKSRYNTVLSPHGVNRVIDRIIKTYNVEEEQIAERERRKPELLPHFSCHNLRHTFCTRFCENETNLKVIQEIMGHADITTTMDIYNEATKEKKMESFAGLEGKIKIR